MIKHTALKALPESERPRERLLEWGADSLSLAELIAIVLQSGTRGKSVLEVAHELLKYFGDLKALWNASVEELCQVKGIGRAKAIKLKAAFSIGQRCAAYVRKETKRIQSSSQAYEWVRDMIERQEREYFVALLLDVQGNVFSTETIAVGTLSQALVHPREVFFPAIKHKASNIIVAHNHPSGDPEPSEEDIQLTEVLAKAGRLLQIPVTDHIIVGWGRFVSLRERCKGLLE